MPSDVTTKTESSKAAGTVRFRDGIGVRIVSADSFGEPIEQLQLCTDIAGLESAVRERVSRLINFRHVRYVRLRGSERLTNATKDVVVTYDAVPGTRLSEFLELSLHAPLRIDIDTALLIVRELLPAIAVLHDSRNVTHGAIGPERLVLTPQGRLVIVDHGLGLALGKLGYSRKRFWSQLRVPTPQGTGKIVFDARTDVIQIGMVALALILGRPIEEEEFPQGLEKLLDSAKETPSIGSSRPLSNELRAWLDRSLPLEKRVAFATVREAQQEFEKLFSGTRYGANSNALKTLVTRYAAVAQGKAPVEEPPAAAAAAPEPIGAPIENPIERALGSDRRRTSAPPPLVRPDGHVADETEVAVTSLADAVGLGPKGRVRATTARKALVTPITDTLSPSVKAPLTTAAGASSLPSINAKSGGLKAPEPKTAGVLKGDAKSTTTKTVDVKSAGAGVKGAEPKAAEPKADAKGAQKPAAKAPLAADVAAFEEVASDTYTDAQVSIATKGTQAAPAAAVEAGGKVSTSDVDAQSILLMDSVDDETPLMPASAFEEAPEPDVDIFAGMGARNTAKAIEVKAPEVKAPAVKAPAAKTAEVKPAEPKAPALKVEVKAPEVKVPELKTPAAKAPETKVPAVNAPAAIAPAAKAPVAPASSNAPAASGPAVNAPAAKTPAVNVPAAVMPPAGGPAVNAPAAKVPAVNVPAVNVPAANIPAEPASSPLFSASPAALVTPAAPVAKATPPAVPVVPAVPAAPAAPAATVTPAAPASTVVAPPAAKIPLPGTPIAQPAAPPAAVAPPKVSVPLPSAVPAAVTPVAPAASVITPSSTASVPLPVSKTPAPPVTPVVPSFEVTPVAASPVATTPVTVTPVAAPPAAVTPVAAAPVATTPVITPVAPPPVAVTPVAAPPVATTPVAAPPVAPPAAVTPVVVAPVAKAPSPVAIPPVVATPVVAPPPVAMPSLPEPELFVEPASPVIAEEPAKKKSLASKLWAAVPKPKKAAPPPSIMAVPDDMDAVSTPPAFVAPAATQVPSAPAAATSMPSAPAKPVAQPVAPVSATPAAPAAVAPVAPAARVTTPVAPVAPAAQPPQVATSPATAAGTPATPAAESKSTSFDWNKDVAVTDAVPAWARGRETTDAPQGGEGAVDFDESSGSLSAAVASASSSPVSAFMAAPKPVVVSKPDPTTTSSSSSSAAQAQASASSSSDSRALLRPGSGFFGADAAAEAEEEAEKVVAFKPRRQVQMPRIRINWRRTIAACFVVSLFEGVAFATAYWYVTPAETGSLLVETTPVGIEILVDGRVAGRTPFSDSLTPGRHTIELRQGSNSRVIPVEISSGVQTMQRITWARGLQTGQARVTATAQNSHVTIDGKNWGKAPLTVSTLAAGKHMVQIESDAGTVSTPIAVSPGETTELDVPIYPGWVSVLAPVQLFIYEGERFLGTTEGEKLMLAPGKHKLDFVSEELGFKRAVEVTITPGATAAVSLPMPKVAVTVEGPEGGELIIDGEPMGRLPLTGLQIALGTRDFVVKHPDLGEKRQVVTVTSHSPMRVTLR